MGLQGGSHIVQGAPWRRRRGIRSSGRSTGVPPEVDGVDRWLRSIGLPVGLDDQLGYGRGGRSWRVTELPMARPSRTAIRAAALSRPCACGSLTAYRARVCCPGVAPASSESADVGLDVASETLRKLLPLRPLRRPHCQLDEPALRPTPMTSMHPFHALAMLRRAPASLASAVVCAR